MPQPASLPTTVQGIIDMMVALAPPRLAASWDNVGLQVGDPTRRVAGLAIALDPTYEAVQQTLEAGATMLVTHHPLLFKPPKSLDLRVEPGRTLQLLIKHDIALYAAHTNLDATAVNVALAAAIGLTGTQILDTQGAAPDYLLAVFVPVPAVQPVLEAAWEAGAGRSAGHERAAHALPARGSFRAAAEGQAAPGTALTREEERLEFRVRSADLDRVRRAIAAAHPDDVPALDAIALSGGGEPYGWGLVGDLETASTLGELARRVKQSLGVAAVRIVGDANRPIHRVAWLGGSGGDYFPQALAAGAQAYITGEVRHHAALDALAAGMSFIEVGHVGSEQPVVHFLHDFFRKQLGDRLPITALHQTDPFTVI